MQWLIPVLENVEGKLFVKMTKYAIKKITYRMASRIYVNKSFLLQIAYITEALVGAYYSLLYVYYKLHIVGDNIEQRKYQLNFNSWEFPVLQQVI